MDVRRLVAGLAFLSSLCACVVVAGGGLVLLAVESSGERGTGALLALSGTIAFAAAMLLVFAGRGMLARMFTRSGGRALAVTAALLGALPMAALAAAAMHFSGVPLGSATPLLDWLVFALGLLLALGALSVLALGAWRFQEARVQEARVKTGQPDERQPTMAPSAKAAPVVPQAAKAEAPSEPAVSAEQTPKKAAGLEEGALRWRSAPGQEAAEQDIGAEDDDDVRVTPVVDLPSIGQFRRR